MRLSPREIDKLALHAAGSLAQKRLARGLRLNHPEAVALIASVLLELIRDGRDGENLGVAALMDAGRRILGKRHVLPSVVGILHEVQVEGTFVDGTKLVTVHDPIATDDGDLELAQHEKRHLEERQRFDRKLRAGKATPNPFTFPPFKRGASVSPPPPTDDDDNADDSDPISYS